MQLVQLPPPGTLTPFLLAIVMAVGDWRSRRIPNFLTFGGALAGIVFQTAVMGWAGLFQALTGLLLGLGLLLLPYILGGMGAGDVKALAALGAWLGPKGIFSVFCYMGTGRRSYEPGSPCVEWNPVELSSPGLGLAAESDSLPQSKGRCGNSDAAIGSDRGPAIWCGHCPWHGGFFMEGQSLLKDIEPVVCELQGVFLDQES